LNQALKYLKQAHELLPDEEEIILHLAEVYAALNKIKEAKEMYEKALKLDSDNKSIQQKLKDLLQRKP